MGMGGGAMGGGMGGSGSGMAFTIDGKTFDGARVDTSTRLGTTEDWIVRNTSAMDHPFHLHVWPFQVVDGPATSGWKDTVNVPANGAVRIRIPFRDYDGTTVYHCHILDHEDLGMMGVIDVTR
jgi:FtsP/CotA-like multicopper oxidase with cupredoxin domain